MVKNKKKFMTPQARKMYMNSQVMSRYVYNAPILAGEPENVKKRVFKVLHRAARFVRGEFCFKENIEKLMKSVGWKKPEEIMNEASARFCHKVIHQKEPQCLNSLIKYPRSRQTADFAPKFAPRSGRAQRCPIASGIGNFNRIEPKIRNLNPKKIKYALKKTRLLPAKVS